MLIIQSVVINKKIPLIQAEKIVTSLNKKPTYLNKKVTEYKAGQTINYYRFRQIPSSKFKENSFRSKKINQYTYFILGELK